VIEICNSISIILGFAAWLPPFVILSQCHKISCPKYAALMAVSFVSCSFSICTQLFSTSYLVKAKDWSALMDTSHGIALISVQLIVVTCIINITASLVYFSKNK
jgi:cytochrome c oxidase subunit 4